MKHLLLALLLMTVSRGRVMAQNDMQKIESQKIAYITNRLNLTTEQAPQFWVIYNDYNGKRKELNRRVRQLTGANSRSQSLTNNDAMSNLRELSGARQKLGALDEEYQPRFLKVISPQQLQELYKAESNFNRMLLEKLNSNQD